MPYVNIHVNPFGAVFGVCRINIATVPVGTSLPEIFAKAGAIEQDFDFLGEHFHAVMRYEGALSVALHETFTDNVVSGVGVKKRPFATFKVGKRVNSNMPKKKAEKQQPDFPFIASITIAQDCSDYRDEPNRIHYIFKSKFKEEEEFVQAVKYAVQDWISADPQSFANSVSEHGMDDLAVKPGKRGYLSAASKVEVNWKMVACGMPDEIASRHGFIAPEPDISITADEYDSL